MPIVAASVQEPSNEGFLSKLQTNLLCANSNETFAKLPWLEDDTIIVVQGETRFVAGSWLATLIDEQTSSLLVATANAARLDATLVSANRPRHGLCEPSAFRPTLQVLPLALEILWEPLNFYGLVQFLTHPVSPLPYFARRQLAAKVADKPGIGGKAWEDVLADIDQHYGNEVAPSVREKIKLWVEQPRFSQGTGAPVDVVLERVQHLVDFFQNRLTDEDPSTRMAFYAGFSQCRSCAESLKHLQTQGVESIRPRQLQTLVTQATANGTDNPLLITEVGSQLAITHPSAAVEAVDQVIWWQLSMPVLPASYPWSADEIKGLADVGVALPKINDILALTAQEWLRPILAARKKLILVLPPKGEEVHPVWQMIEAVVKNPVIHSLEQFLSMPSFATRLVEHKPLPAPRRWWQLPADVNIPLRVEESFSSLELLLFNPYNWLLKYPARLRSSSIVTLSGDFRMFGNLAHGLVENLYQRKDALQMGDVEFDKWFTENFARQINEEGAVFLMAGKRSELEGFRFRLRQSLQSLRQQLANAEITTVSPELKLNGQFAGGELSGYADLVMQSRSGERAIVDMKWSGASKYPKKLKENRHLQLAIYAELLRQMNGTWPVVAYYILDQARLFAPDTRVFQNAEIVPSESGENTAQLWQRFNCSWTWRRTQIDSGLIEVALESIEPTEESAPPTSAMTSEYLNEAYNEYRALAGWRF